MLISHSLKCPYLHYKHCSQTEKKKSKRARETSNLLFTINQRCSAARNCVRQEEQGKRSATKVRHYIETSPFSFSVTFRCWLCIMKRQIPRGICFCGSTEDKCKPNRTTINIQKVLVLLALLRSVLYPADVSTSQNHQDFTK